MLRKHGGNKAKREVGAGESEGSVGASSVSNQFDEMPSPSPAISKSVSVDPPGSENERPSSQQSGRGGGKKKILSNFLSNLFGNNKIPESELNPESMSKKKSSSHESINSVLSSSSFSYVTPKKYRGKPTKGKRIPVDDPTYGGGTRSVANTGKNNDAKTKPLGTIDKIGMKIGLKKKYNLQSCESLQYIDACCDDGPPCVGNIPIVDGVTRNESPTELDSGVLTDNPSSISAECQAITQHFSMPPPSPEPTPSLREKPPSPKLSSSSPSSPSQQLKLQFLLSTPTPFTPVNAPIISPTPTAVTNPPTTSVTPSATPSSLTSISTSSVLETTVTTTSTTSVITIPVTSTQTFSVITAPTSSTTKSPVTTTFPITVTTTPVSATGTPNLSVFINPITPSASKEPDSVLSANSVKPKNSKIFETSVPQQAIPETPSSSAPEPVASTSAASILTNSPISHPPIKPSLFPVGSSNTWSNSTRRKRRAPQPPSNNSPFRFSNTEETQDNSSEVPCSSSQAAALMKFSRLNEQPHSSDAFEIRPRKKERSLEPLVVSRPPSIDGSYITNSLSHSRFGHKRANSESCSTNTRGRIHKPGKKKAPAPPNPFGDPNATTEQNAEDVNTLEPIPTTSQAKPKPNDKPPLCPVVIRAKPQELHLQPQQSQPVVPPSLNDSTAASESTDTCTPTNSALMSIEPSVPQPEECSPDLMEEIRQNMLNDQQERQQLGYSAMIDNIPTTILQTSEAANSTESQASLRTSDISLPVSNVNDNHPITENDVQAARHTLVSLSASVSPNRKDVSSDVKTKLSDLKHEAERSPLNVKRNKTRPTSIGSSIYESPLALFLGKSSGSNNTSNATDSATDGDSPRATPKPWYKRSATGALIKPFSHKSKPTSVKPFTSLVKFSELDKEASKIIEENKRKSAEQKFNENAQELIALFSTSFPETQQPDTDTDSGNNIQPVQTNPPKATSHIKVSTTAQVHSIAEEVEEINQRQSVETLTPTAQANLPSALDSLPETTQPTITNNGSSSPPTFQSVHAASKHRQIKPLLTTSPISNIRFEKLAIVQPQTNLSNQESVPIPTPRRCLETTSMLTPITPPSTTVQSSTNASLTTSALIDVEVISKSDSSTSPPATNPPITPQVSISNSQPNTTIAALPIANKSSSEAQWDCPRCTLKNSNWRVLCEICFYRKDTTNSASSYISSILQRVNAEIASTKVTSSTSSSSPITTTNSVRRLSATFSNGIPSSVTATTSVITPSLCSTVSNNGSRSIPSRETQVNDVTSIRSSHHETKSDIPPCENFLSQLPVKQDLAKEEKLQGIKLHEDPELEELDVGKLREVRLAYFQKQHSTTTTSQSASGDSVKNTQNNNLACGSDSSHINNNPPRDNVDENERDSCNLDNGENGTSSETEISHHPKQTFSDNEDDFLDYMLQLNNDENTTNVANITGSLPRPLKPPSPSPSVCNSTPAMSPTTQTPSPILFLQNRYRPRLEAIREGNSQDYTYCYSSSEITQIYENWQANQNSGESINKFVVNSPTSSPTAQSGNSVQSFLPTHLLDFQQHQQTSTIPLHSPNEPHLSHVYPTSYGSRSKTNLTHVVPIMSVDHQPHANNRLSDNSDKNYVNTIAPTSCIGVGGGASTPTLNESANFSCATSSVCFPTFPLVHSNNSHSVVVNDHNHPINNMNRSGRDRHLPQLPPFRYSEANNYENNTMNFNPGSSRRLTYEDYRKMGAIPKGYPFNARNDDWSSESSCDTESSRGFWGRANPDSPLGMTRRGTLDYCQSQENGFPDQTPAVGKLMKRLEAAITNGDHRLAATLAHDLALMKVNCVVAKINQPFSIRVYVEDRFMQQGPFLVHVTAMMTVCELKGKIESDWGIPSGFQKWILGRRMAEDDNLSISAFDMAEDSMAFLFLVTPEIGNSHSGMISVDNSKPNNYFSAGEPTTSSSSIGRNVTENCRKSVSPSHHNIMATYNNVNENSSHVYNNLFENTSNSVPTNSKKPDFLITVNRESPAKILLSSQSISPNSSKNASPIPGRRFEKPVVPTNLSLTTSEMRRENEIKEDNLPPPPLPSRSPIPHQALPPKCQQTKNKVKSASNNIMHSKTPEPANSDSLKSNPKTSKSQNTSIGSGSSKDLNNLCRNQQSGISPDTLSAASALTLSLQQKLAEFKVVAEQTFSKPSQAKEQSPAPLKTKGAKQPDTDVKITKDPVPKRKTGKVTTSSNKNLSSAHSSTEKLAKENSKQDATPEKSVQPENRFNGILLSTSMDNENLEPPERSDKPKDSSAQNLHKRPPKGTKPIEKQKVVSSPERENTPVNFVEASAVISATPQKVEKAVSPTMAQVGLKETHDSVNELESLVSQVKTESTVPQPKPRGLKKQQSVEKTNQAIEPPKPVPRTTVCKTPLSGAKSESKSSETEQEITLIPTTIYTIEGTTSTTSGYVNLSQMDEGCQTTLPFPAMKQRAASATPTSSPPPTYTITLPLSSLPPTPLSRTISPSAKAESPQQFIAPTSTFTPMPNKTVSPPPQLNVSLLPASIASSPPPVKPIDNLSGANFTPNDPVKGLLRPSDFVSQAAPSKFDSHFNASLKVSDAVAENRYHEKSNDVNTSVLLPLITANPVLPPLDTKPSENSKDSATNLIQGQLSQSAKQSTLTANITQQSRAPLASVSTVVANSEITSTKPEEPRDKSKEDNVNSYLHMLELMEKQDLIFTTEDAECPVCFASLPIGEGIILRDCLHSFCKECLVGCVQYADDSAVKCPYRDNSYACNNNLQEREIKALVPVEVFEKYLARSVKLAESKIVNTFHCKTPDCTGWCVFEDDVNVFVCPCCKKRNCLTCAAIHEGVDCLKFQRELAIAAETDEDAKQSRLMLEKMIQRGEALECPACHVVLLKKWGCDWVRCSYCKTEICWVTKGFRWGKGGKGDLTGGCRCGVNGVKCHPKCTYCH